MICLGRLHDVIEFIVQSWVDQLAFFQLKVHFGELVGEIGGFIRKVFEFYLEKDLLLFIEHVELAELEDLGYF